MQNKFINFFVHFSLLTLTQYYFRNSYDAEILLALLKCFYIMVQLLPEKVMYVIEDAITGLL